MKKFKIPGEIFDELIKYSIENNFTNIIHNKSIPNISRSIENIISNFVSLSIDETNNTIYDHYIYNKKLENNKEINCNFKKETMEKIDFLISIFETKKNYNKIINKILYFHFYNEK